MIRRISSLIALAGVLALAGVALAACGGGDNGGATSTVGTAGTPRPPSSAAAAPTVAPTQAASMAAPTAAATMATTPASGGGTGSAVAVTEKDFAITLDNMTAPAGQVTFNVTNNGPSEHEFVVIKTDLAPDQLPVNPDVYAVDTTAAGLTSIGQATNIAAGASTTLNVNLTPGRYVLICNLPAHYQQGMRIGFSVQ
jgi:uncharacterized cupredoxin-like copper-binding protein